MYKCHKVILTIVLMLSAGFCLAQSHAYPGVGRSATVKEVAAWDIDVRPDFNEVFSPLIGGTTDEDIKTGRVANLTRRDFPGRTTIMKVATVSTLWDYINRAMPWTAPKSLKTDEVYAVLAYMLSLANVVPEDYVLSDKNIAEVQ